MSTKMLIRSVEIVIPIKLGFHLRILTRFIECVRPFHSSVHIRKGTLKANGKSIMGLLALAATWKSRLHIEAEGTDATEAIEAIKHFFRLEAAAEIISENEDAA